MMILHVNERKKEQALNLYFALLIPHLLSFLLRLGYCRAHPNKFEQIFFDCHWKSLSFSSI